MKSLIFERIALFFFPILHLFAFFILMRGHNAPGGGFIGGLVSAAAFVLYALAFGPAKTQKLYRVHPFTIAGCGLFFSLSAGFISVLMDKAFFTGIWGTGWLSWVGTPVIFDVGVYLVVVAVTLTIVMNLLRSE